MTKTVFVGILVLDIKFNKDVNREPFFFFLTTSTLKKEKIYKTIVLKTYLFSPYKINMKLKHVYEQVKYTVG